MVLTHAVESPCIFQLVSPPESGDGLSLGSAEIRCELVGNGVCCQQRAIQVKCNDRLAGHLDYEAVLLKGYVQRGMVRPKGYLRDSRPRL